MKNKKFISVLVIIFDVILVRNGATVTCEKLSKTIYPKPRSHIKYEQVKYVAPKIKYGHRPMNEFQLSSLDGRKHHSYFTDFYDYENEHSTDRIQKIVEHLPKTTTESSFDFLGEDEYDDDDDDEDEEYHNDDDNDEYDDYGKYEETDKEETDYGEDEDQNPNAEMTLEDKRKQIILRRLRRKHETHELIFPLLMAYKLKFFIMLPLLVGALVLLIGTTGVAGFFFALFSAALGLRAKTH